MIQIIQEVIQLQVFAHGISGLEQLWGSHLPLLQKIL